MRPLVGRHPSGRPRPRGSTGIARKLLRVHRQMAIFISGALRTTATDVACLHANLPPFKILVNLMCQRATLRMASLPDSHPLRGHLIRASHYVQRHRSPLHELIRAFDIRPGQVETIADYRPAPDAVPTLESIIHSREEAPRFDRRNPVQVKLYSDGSSHNGGVGAAAVLMRVGASFRILRMYLGSDEEHTVYEAELVGMNLAMELLRTERRRVGGAALGVENQAALRSTTIGRPRPGHYLVRELDKAVKAVRKARPAIHLKGHWTPGHSGIAGNEMGDEEAKRAAAGDSSAKKDLRKTFQKKLPHSVSARKQAYRRHSEELAAQIWTASPRIDRLAMRDVRMHGPLRFFHKHTIKLNLTRRQHSMFVQLRTGHIGLNGHLFKIGKAMDAECSHCAGEVETVAHFLMRCPAYERERRLYLHRRGRRPESIAELLTTPEAFKRVIRSVDATKRLGAIFGDEPNLRESLCSRHCPKRGGGGGTHPRCPPQTRWGPTDPGKTRSQ